MIYHIVKEGELKKHLDCVDCNCNPNVQVTEFGVCYIVHNNINESLDIIQQYINASK